uniref:Uncharacterized protein n=1 Tax=Nicotiana tabacum TaxID=4097 RepID=A0A1S4A9K6_TOBAC|nr:PREDICTED: uncharacterized protein LOC107795212 [Nicotiana tabacum]
MSALPFPQKHRREELDKQFGRFLLVLKQVHVNIPFMEVLSQMPSYAKFLKEVLSKKQKVEETSVVKLTEKLEGDNGEIRSILVSLQLTDHTTIIPEGLMEDVLVGVDKFVFPVDFIVVNMEENWDIPQILGRPFLATGRAILDIQERQLMLRVREERPIFKMEGERGSRKEQLGESKTNKCRMYLEKAEKKLSAWMCALGRACKGDPDLDLDPN